MVFENRMMKTLGQYMQMGIVYRVSVSSGTMDALGLNEEKLLDELNKKMDMSLFDRHEHDDAIDFTLKESIVLEQLHRFMQTQFSLYSRNDREEAEVFEKALCAVSESSSLQEIIELSEEKRFYCFQNNRIDESIKISTWKSLRFSSSMFVLFVEGKLYMEQYNSFLNYLEMLVRSTSELPIKGAFRAFID